MGRDPFSKVDYDRKKKTLGIVSDSHVTAKAEKQAFASGTLSALVDPAHDPIRRSLMRLDATTLPDGRKAYVCTMGTPLPLEALVDTTGSMGGNVDVMMVGLPETYGYASQMAPGYDVQYAPGIFGDVCDKFPFQRSQFEMTAGKLVDSLSNMVPERKGGDVTEDPLYGIFGAAYLTDAYINQIGLKSYHFTVTDAPTRSTYKFSQLTRIFGKDVLAKVRENCGINFTEADIGRLHLKTVVSYLSQRAHAFFLATNEYAAEEWRQYYDAEHVVVLPTCSQNCQYLPQVQAAIIGLTEGTIVLDDVWDFFKNSGMPSELTTEMAENLEHIPLGAQADLQEQMLHPLPKAGDIFLNKTDVWPVQDTSEFASSNENANTEPTFDLTWL